MRRTSCERWTAVIDARAIGNAVSAQDMIFAERHEATCSSCGAEAHVWRSFSKISAAPRVPSGIFLGRSEPGVHVADVFPGDDTPYDAILRALPSSANSSPRMAMRGRIGLAAGAIAMCAASAIGVAVLLRNIDARRQSLASTERERAREVFVSPVEHNVLVQVPNTAATDLAVTDPRLTEPPPPADAPTVPSSRTADGLAAPPAHALSRRAAVGQGLAHASVLRRQGDYRGAAAEYRAAYTATPQAAEGKAALVFLGDVLLTDLGDPRGALSAFDTYLSNPGALRRQAAYGRVRALRAMGWTAEEGAAAQAFLARYPTGPDAEALRRDVRSPHEK